MPESNSVIRQLWHPIEPGRNPQIYAILDAARDEGIYPAVMDFASEYSCLLGEGIPAVLAKASPYLIRLEPEDALTAQFISEGWGDSWGIFLESDASFAELRLHVRSLLMAKDESGKEMYFRYYDPRVLRAYLPTCSESELGMVFGPIGFFLVEGEDMDTLMEYSHADSRLDCNTISLQPSSADKVDSSRRSGPAAGNLRAGGHGFNMNKSGAILTIRREQMQALEASHENGYVQGLIAYLRSEIPEETADLADDELEKMVDYGLSKIRNYGIQQEPNLKLFLTIMFLVAPNFDRHPVVASILEDDSLDPDQRIHLLRSNCSDDTWNEAAENNDFYWGMAESAKS